MSAWIFDEGHGCTDATNVSQGLTFYEANETATSNSTIYFGIMAFPGFSRNFCNYGYVIDHRPHATNTTRSVGWHHLVLSWSNARATFQIDDSTVGQADYAFVPDRFEMGSFVDNSCIVVSASAETNGCGGPFGYGSGPAWWDDVSFASPGMLFIGNGSQPAPDLAPIIVVTSVSPGTIVIHPNETVRFTATISNLGNESGAFGFDVQDLVTGLTWESVGVDLASFHKLDPGASEIIEMRLKANATPSMGPLVARVASGSSFRLLPIVVESDARPAGFTDAPLPRLPTLTLAVSAATAIGASALVVALVARSPAGRAAGAALVVPLYTRLKRSDVLAHEVRADVHAHVAAHPGVRFEELRRALALPNGVLEFHLRVLQREGFVTTRDAWTRRVYYATGSVAPPADARAGDVIARLLADEPGLRLRDVAARLSMSKQLAQYHLRALERQGKVRSEGSGAARVYRAAPT